MIDNELTLLQANDDTSLSIPSIEGGIAAGFPSPCQDYLESSIDLNKELIRNASATFCARVAGNSMIDEGIEEGDILVIDRSITPRDGKIVVCFIDGEFTLKTLRIQGQDVWLQPANSAYPNIPISAENHFQVWGVVTYVIKKKG